MASRRWRWLIGLSVAQLALLLATLPLDALGARTWHHVASLGAVLTLASLVHQPLRRSRRFLAFGVLATSILAVVSGFYLLYFKAGVRAAGIQDWGVFWHIAWSWAAAIFFLQHTWINRIQLLEFIKRSIAPRAGAIVHAGAYLLVLAALVATWAPAGRGAFTNETYYPYGLRAWVLLLVPTYAFWLYLTLRSQPGYPAWLARFGHWPIRRLVDLALVPTAALTILSGFPLLFDGPFDAAGMKYVTKTWHVWPSILFTVLVFVHSVQAWRTVKAHWRNAA